MNLISAVSDYIRNYKYTSDFEITFFNSEYSINLLFILELTYKKIYSNFILFIKKDNEFYFEIISESTDKLMSIKFNDLNDYDVVLNTIKLIYQKNET